MAWQVLFLVLVLSGTCYAQVCKSSCDAGLSTCGNIKYKVYVNDQTSLILNEIKIQQVVIESNYMRIQTPNNDGTPTKNCANAMQEALCNFFHPACDPRNLTNPTPIKPCLSMCTHLQKYCGLYQQFLPPIIQPYFNCSAVDPATNEPIYTPDNETCSVLNTTKNSCKTPKPFVPPYSGVCAKFDPVQAPTFFNTCGMVISETVSVPNPWPNIQGYIEYINAATINLITSAYPLTPLKCHEYLLADYCKLFFPSCYDYAGYGLPRLPCQSLCYNTTAKDVCGDWYANSRLPQNYFPDCSNAYFAPANFSVDPGDGTKIPIPCDDEQFPKDSVSPYAIAEVGRCPLETGRNTKWLENGLAPCTLQCPDSSYTAQEWENLNDIITVGATFSLVAMTFLIISYLLQYEKRKFPSILHIWEFCATSMFAIGFLINGRHPEKHVWCFDEGTYATQSNVNACAVQGFFFIVFGISLTAWCFVIAFIMFYAIVFNRRVNNLQKFTPVFHLFAWGGPLVFGITALATKSIGYGPPLAWCFIHFQGFGYGSGGVSRDYPLFYIPEAVLFIPILIMFLSTVSKIIYVRRLNVEGSNVAKRGTRTFRAQVRVLIFSFMVFIIIFTIFEWRLQIEGKKGNISEVGIQWAYCKVRNELKIIPNDYICEGDISPARINYQHTAFESFVLSGIGIIIFMGFGADLGIYQHWSKLARLAWYKKWDDLRDLIKFGRDPWNPKGSSGSKPKSGSGSSQQSPSNSQLSRTQSNLSQQNETGSIGSRRVEFDSDSVNLSDVSVEESRKKVTEVFPL